MGRYECEIINSLEQVGEDYVAFTSIATWSGNRRLRNFIGALRRSGAIRCKKFVARERQLRSGRLYAHRDDIAWAVEMFEASTRSGRRRPRGVSVGDSVSEPEVVEQTKVAVAEPTRGVAPRAAIESMDSLRASVDRLTVAVGDLLAAISLEAEVRERAAGAVYSPVTGDRLRLSHSLNGKEG